MKMIPVMALKNKSKENRYLAASMEAGDWSDKDLDVTSENIHCALLIWNEDNTAPNQTNIDELRELSRAHKKNMVERFGDDATVSFDVDEWLKVYEPVNLEITEEQLQQAKEMGDL